MVQAAPDQDLAQDQKQRVDFGCDLREWVAVLARRPRHRCHQLPPDTACMNDWVFVMKKFDLDAGPKGHASEGDVDRKNLNCTKETSGGCRKPALDFAWTVVIKARLLR